MTEGNKIKIDISFIRQKTHYFCGPASLQMIFNYYNIYKDQDDLAKKLETCEEFGTKNIKMIQTVKENGFYCLTKKSSTLNDIYKMLFKKIPVIVNYMEPTDEEPHFAVVSGMNDS